MKETQQGEKVPLCPKCGKEGVWCANEEVYGKRYGKSYMCYYCFDCDTYVGCHNNTREALGEMADKETRQWRMTAHSVIDPLWKSGKYKRKTIYKRLNEAFGYEVHISQSSIELCKDIIKTAELIFNHDTEKK